MLLILKRNARPVIAETDGQIRALLHRGDRDFPAGGSTVTQGIGEQIGERLLDPVSLHVNGRKFPGHLQGHGDAAIRYLSLQLLDHITKDSCDIGGRRLKT